MWDESQKADANYEQLGLVVDANLGFGRNKRPDRLAGAQERSVRGESESEGEEALDDDLKAAMAKVRSTGKAAPKRLTPRQRQIVEALIKAHGEDVDAMTRDRKRNAMQHTKAQLQALIGSYQHWSENSGVDFRVPTKGLW